MEEKDTSSLEERLKEKIKQKDEIISDKNIKDAIVGSMESSIGPISILSTDVSKNDKISNAKVRMGIARDVYKVPVGLYAIGSPDHNSDILVTANYKLTLDLLRVELKNLNLWILVIDTKGVNVWCGAGKGTFSTEEIIYRIKKLKLNKLVNHKRIILPQLGAPGVGAHQITKFTGFKPVYGPVYAKDIKEFIDCGYKANEEMRKVKFGLIERLKVSPIETINAFKYLSILYLFFVILRLINNESLYKAMETGLYNTIPYAVAIIIGTIIFPMLLPILPYRMFSKKAVILGLLWSTFVVRNYNFFQFSNIPLGHIGNSLLITSIISFLAMNYTGSTTFTSLSGVKKETDLTLPIVGITSLASVIMLIITSLIY